MRDIRGDLKDRADWLHRQITVESARFERLIGQLKLERARRLAQLKAERDAVSRLNQLAAWQQNASGTLLTAIAAMDGVAIALADENSVPVAAPVKTYPE